MNHHHGSDFIDLKLVRLEDLRVWNSPECVVVLVKHEWHVIRLAEELQIIISEIEDFVTHERCEDEYLPTSQIMDLDEINLLSILRAKILVLIISVASGLVCRASATLTQIRCVSETRIIDDILQITTNPLSAPRRFLPV